MNNGVFIILPYVIIYEDVLHTLIKGVNPKWLPPTNGEGITRPPRENQRRSWEREKPKESRHEQQVHTTQSGPEILPGPGQSSGTGTGLVRHYEWTRGPHLVSARFPSYYSGSSPGPCLLSTEK